MKKWILIGTGALVAIVIVVIILGISNLGPIIKHAVNTYGPTMTKTELRLDDVGISIFSGEAKLKGFFLGNPKGFSSPEAMTVGSIYVNVDEKSITKDPVVVDKIEVVRPVITYEKRGKTDNFKTIMDNVRSGTKQEKSPTPAAGKEGGSKKLVIREFLLRDGKVTLSESMVSGKTISASLPEIRLTNIGVEGKGVTQAEAMEKVMAVLYKQLTSPVVVDALKERLKASGLGTEAMQGATKELEKATGGTATGAGGVTDKVKGLLEN